MAGRYGLAIGDVLSERDALHRLAHGFYWKPVASEADGRRLVERLIMALRPHFNTVDLTACGREAAEPPREVTTPPRGDRPDWRGRANDGPKSALLAVVNREPPVPDAGQADERLDTAASIPLVALVRSGRKAREAVADIPAVEQAERWSGSPGGFVDMPIGAHCK